MRGVQGETRALTPHLVLHPDTGRGHRKGRSTLCVGVGGEALVVSVERNVGGGGQRGCEAHTAAERLTHTNT